MLLTYVRVSRAFPPRGGQDDSLHRTKVTERVSDGPLGQLRRAAAVRRVPVGQRQTAAGAFRQTGAELDVEAAGVETVGHQSAESQIQVQHRLVNGPLHLEKDVSLDSLQLEEE